MEFGLIKPLSPSETKRLRPLESKEQTIMRNISNLFMLLMGGGGVKSIKNRKENIFLPPNNLLFVSHGLMFPYSTLSRRWTLDWNPTLCKRWCALLKIEIQYIKCNKANIDSLLPNVCCARCKFRILPSLPPSEFIINLHIKQNE